MLLFVSTQLLDLVEEGIAAEVAATAAASTAAAAANTCRCRSFSVEFEIIIEGVAAGAGGIVAESDGVAMSVTAASGGEWGEGTATLL